MVGADLSRRQCPLCAARPVLGVTPVFGERQELLKLGFEVSERTVSRLMPRRRKPPSQSWRTFLKNHLGSTVAVDFFAVPTLTCRILFVFVVLAHDRRRILHVNVTRHPTSAWTRQQLRESFPNTPPRDSSSTTATRPSTRRSAAPPKRLANDTRSSPLDSVSTATRRAPLRTTLVWRTIGQGGKIGHASL